MQNKGKLLFTTEEVSKLLGISHVAVFKRIKAGKINAEKIGGNYLIPKSELALLGINIKDDLNAIPNIPEVNELAKEISHELRNTIFAKDGETLITKHSDFFKTKFDIGNRDIIIGFNEPAFKKSNEKLLEADLDSPLNARFLTYFLPAVQIAQMQKRKPRLVIVTGINAALRYNAKNEYERKIIYRNNMLKLKFVEETLNKFFPNTFSIIETRLAYDFMKISEEKIDKLWNVFIKRFPERMKPLTEDLKRFSSGGDNAKINDEKLHEAFRYAVLHLFVLGDINLDYDFIHNKNGYVSIGEHQELIFNIVREIGYEILKDIGDIIFEREVHCFKNPKIIINDEGHVPPPYNGAFRTSNKKTSIDEVTYENKRDLSYYDERPRLKPHLDYLYKTIPKEIFEKYWREYKPRYIELKKRYDEAYDIF